MSVGARRCLAVLAAGIAALACACASSTVDESAFEVPHERVARELVALSGPDARDCGTYSLAQPRASGIACAQEAIATGTPYRVAFELQGVDSDIWEGAARDRAGTHASLFLDSDVTGGAPTPDPRLYAATCEDVVFFAQGEHAVECVGAVLRP